MILQVRSQDVQKVLLLQHKTELRMKELVKKLCKCDKLILTKIILFLHIFFF